MKIAMITDVRLDSSSNAGNKVAILSLLEVLMVSNQVTLINLNRRTPELPKPVRCISLGHLYLFCRILTRFLSARPATLSEHKRAKLLPWVINAILKNEAIDVVIIQYLEHTYLLDGISNKFVKLCDLHDIMHKRKSAYAAMQLPVEPYFDTSEQDELALMRKYAAVIAIQREEHLWLKSRGISSIHLPRPIPGGASGKAVNTKSGARLSIGFLGGKNAINAQCLEVVVGIARQTPDAVFIIAGQVSQGMVSRDNIHVLGPLDDVEVFYRSVDVVINPIAAGSGLKMKTVEAFCYGRPVLGTPEAFAGIDIENEPCALIAHHYDDFIAKISDLRLANLTLLKERSLALYAREFSLKSLAISSQRALQALCATDIQ